MALQPCPACDGARLRPESLAVTVGGLNIYEYTQFSAQRGARVDRGARADRDRARDRPPGRARDRRAAALPRLGRDRLPVARARRDDALGRRGAADPARDPDRLEPGRRPLHPRRALDRPAPARQREADRDARAAARPRQHGDRRRARRGHDPRRRPRRRPRPRRRRARGRGGRRGHPGGDRAPAGLADRPVPLRRARDPGPGASAASRAASSSSAAPASTTSRTSTSAFPLGVFTAVTGVSGSGKSTLVNEILYRAVANRLHRARMRPGAHDRIDGIEQVDKIINIDQSPIGRTPRSNPATYTGLFDHIRQLFAGTREARARGYKPGRFSLQRQGRALRGLPRRRPDQDRDALPARRLRALRAVPRAPLQPRDARGPLQGQVDRRRARDVGRRGGRVLRADAEDRAPAADAARRRARLHPARPAGDPALRRRGAAGQARDRALQGRDRRHALHPRRADHRPALRRRRAAARGPRPPRRRRATRWS